MPNDRAYPDGSSGPFPTPPREFTDRTGRQIRIEALEALEGAALEEVASMYDRFSPEDRAQGIPPAGDERIRNWLQALAEGSINVVARHDSAVVGDSMLVPDVEEPASIENVGAIEWELAIFVLQDYQQAGIGTQLLEALLGHGASLGIEQIWLSVERWNDPAIALYERVGFEPTGHQGFEQVMTIRLTAESARP